MNASELNRLLLFHGQNDVTDFLRSSPLNRFLYKKLLGVLSASGIAVPAVKLFNEIYYQCARVNYDGMPGVDVGRRYWSEAAGWMDSPEGAQLVFCAVWAVLGLKRSHTFHEECFLGALVPYLRNSVYARFAEGLAGELRLSGISVPDRFPVMTCPVSEIVAAFTLTKEQAKGFWGYEDPARLIVEDAWRGTWAKVTCDYSPSVIEQYVRLYADQEDQLKLIACMKAPLYPKKHPAQRQFLTDLGQRIATGGFDPEEHPLLQPAVSPDTETKECGGFRLDLGLDGTEGSRNLDMAMRYREERDALVAQVEEMRKAHAMELARREAEYKAEIELLREDNEKLIRWPSKKGPRPSGRPRRGSDVLVFSLHDVVSHVKERFSRSGGEEVCTMLYRFAVEYGSLSEETFKQIDSIMPAIMKRDHPHQTFEFPHVTQFNNNPGTVVNEA